MNSENNKKEFKAFPVRSLRASEKTWDLFLKKKQRSGLSWNGFLIELNKKK